MKKKKMFITGLAVFAIVGVTLALKPSAQGQGSIYCISGPVNPAESCLSQAATLIDVQIVAAGGRILNPCPCNAADICSNPYINGNSTCTPPAVGTQYESTLP